MLDKTKRDGDGRGNVKRILRLVQEQESDGIRWETGHEEPEQLWQSLAVAGAWASEANGTFDGL